MQCIRTDLPYTPLCNAGWAVPLVCITLHGFRMGSLLHSQELPGCAVVSFSSARMAQQQSLATAVVSCSFASATLNCNRSGVLATAVASLLHSQELPGCAVVSFSFARMAQQQSLATAVVSCSFASATLSCNRSNVLATAFVSLCEIWSGCTML